MLEAAKRDAVLAATQALKDGAFKATAIKVEMEGDLGRTWNNGRVEQWFREQLSPEARAALVFLMCYTDGGDTEVTFTLRLDRTKNILLLPEFVETFRELARVCGRGTITVENSGMHMALLYDKDCHYHHSYAGKDVQPYLNNMMKSCGLLMPALYFLASTYENTRSMAPRAPGISSINKYSAIAYRFGSLEFRVFDTCYEQPGIILDNVVVMANIMQFYTEKYTPVKMGVKAVRFGKNGRNGHKPLDDLYMTKTHIQLLNAGLRILKPSYYSIEDVKAQRKFGKTEADCAGVDEAFEAQAKTQYAEYQEREMWRERAETHRARARELEVGYDHYKTPAEALKVAAVRVKEAKKHLRAARLNYNDFKAQLPQPQQGDFLLEGE